MEEIISHGFENSVALVAPTCEFTLLSKLRNARRSERTECAYAQYLVEIFGL
jgi:hypothetical protein